MVFVFRYFEKYINFFKYITLSIDIKKSFGKFSLYYRSIGFFLYYASLLLCRFRKVVQIECLYNIIS